LPVKLLGGRGSFHGRGGAVNHDYLLTRIKRIVCTKAAAGGTEARQEGGEVPMSRG
jgi:hypothetical protein